MRRDVLEFVDHQVRQRPQQLITQQLEVLRRMLAEQGEHPVVGHDWRFLVEQMIFQRPPVKAQGLEEEPVGIVLGEAHLSHRTRHIQPEVFDEPGGGDKAIEQRRGSELALDLVIEARPGAGIAGERCQNTL
ncbi:hypothetical protein D3C78_1182400 [compost metagenome]